MTPAHWLLDDPDTIRRERDALAARVAAMERAMNWKRFADKMPPRDVGTRLVLKTPADVYALVRMSEDGWMYTPAIGDAMRLTGVNEIWTHWLLVEPPAA